MKQSRESRNRLTIDFQQSPKAFNGKRKIFLTNGANGYPYGKKISCPLEKLILDSLDINIEAAKIYSF